MIDKVFPSLKIVKIGSVHQEALEMASTFNLQIKADLGIGGGSTVTLIEADQKILVDTGFDFEWRDDAENRKANARNLRRSLSDIGLTPDDIDIVFLTHWHRDHFGNRKIFKKAQILASQLLVNRFKFKDIAGLDDGEEIIGGVRMVLTPGHTAEHASLIVETRLSGVKARIAVAGDAVVSRSYFLSGCIWQSNADFYDVPKAQESINRLVESSDLIIPGHGGPFLTR